MEYTIDRKRLGFYISDNGRECVYGQIIQQRHPEAFAAAGRMLTSRDALEHDLITNEEVKRVEGDDQTVVDVTLMIKHQKENSEQKCLDALEKLFPGDTFKII